MEEEIIENVDLQNDEEVVEGAGSEDVEALKAKNQSLYEQLQKAKGKVRGDDGKWSKKPETKSESKTEPEVRSDGLDYGQKAFLIASGITGSAEMKFVQEAMKESGKTLEQVLESKYFKAELEDMRELARTANATPQGKRSGNVASDSVEYWMSKPLEDVPQEMRIKVVNAKLKQGENKGVFYNS